MPHPQESYKLGFLQGFRLARMPPPVTLMRLFENKNNTNRHDQFSYHKAGLGGEPYKGETPPDLPVLIS